MSPEKHSPLSGHRILLPLALFLGTCLTTSLVGRMAYSPYGAAVYSLCLMTILLSHELGHYFQTLRYRVRSTYPLFIPVYFPFMPIQFGTLGAIIQMDGRIPNIRALFDIGISGPLAGLVPTLIFAYFGIHDSEILPSQSYGVQLGEPLILTWLIDIVHGPIPEGMSLWASPMLMAAWIGLLLTTINLMPIGQLDGGHVFYALLRERAARISFCIWIFIIAFSFYFTAYHLIILSTLALYFGQTHPPTGDDSCSLGRIRTFLGWAILGFVVLGMTPTPIMMPEELPETQVETGPISHIELPNSDIFA